MTPIQPAIPTGTTAALPGAPPPAAGASPFADLFPAAIRPVQPRKGDAGGGKDLPAVPIGEEAQDLAAWLVPPVIPSICPPVTFVGGAEGGSIDAVAAAARLDSVPAGGRKIGAQMATLASGAVALDGSDLSDAASAIAATPPSIAASASGTPVQAGMPPGLANLLRNGDGQLAAGAARAGPGTRSGVVSDAGVELAPGTPSSAGAIRAAPWPATDASVVAGAVIAKAALQTTVAESGGAEVAARTSGTDRNLASGQAGPLPAGSRVSADPVPPTSRVAPAGEVFAAAIRHAVREENRGSGAHGFMLSPAASAPAVPFVAAADGARQPMLDMQRETWPTRMIEQIAALRDAADANDTSIRLIPDRLGTIDVSLRRDGERVEVNLHAHQPETRALIAEAQPKLVEMGEARGLRLSTHTDTAGNSGQPPPQQQRAPAQSSPAPTAPRGGAGPADPKDQRLA